MLLTRHDTAVAAVLADPHVANDPANSAILEFRSLFEPGSTFADGSIASWAAEAKKGHYYVPGPAGALLTTKVMSVSAVSADEVTIAVCTRESMRINNAAGEIVSAEAGVAKGEVTAVRVNGIWLLRSLSVVGGTCSVQDVTG